jgi:hypothetical protein
VIFNKQGTQVQAPVSDGTFWGSFSTCNQLGGFSDPIVQYDRGADRWLVGEVALPLFPGLFGQYAQCFAVSKTSDPTGSYYMWAYGFGTNVNDYPKIGVWPDAYYVTWNIFQNGSNFIGPKACAFDRNAMLSGSAAPARVCFQLSTAFDSLLPSDLDGATAPPGGAPNYLMNVDTTASALNLWKFHVDFATPGNSTFIGPASIPGVAAFTAPCTNTQDCVPQPGTTTSLDALGDRLMYRLAYRNFGDHESLVANHTVLTSDGNTGVRWYEVRDPNGTATINQQGTFAPDSDYRWMASIAMDKSGNIAVGYSVSSSATYPSIRYTGWEVGDAPGTLQAETSLVAGGGSQTGYDRWGDYSAMRIDPSDDCTFWYTQEYQATTQAADWSTRIGSFKFPSCGQAVTSTTTALTSSLNPSMYGTPVTFTASVTPSSGPTGSVTFQDGSAVLSTQPLNSSGQASYQTSTLAVGPHSITATYGGDTNFSASTSVVLTQTISKANSTTAIASNNNPSTVGQSVMLSATVSPSGATGTAQFFDGATLLGAGALSAGTASLSTTSLSVGSHSITATYSGDGIYVTSSSGALSQVVKSAPTLTGVAISPVSVIGGAGATGFISLSDKAPSGGITVSLSSNKPAATVPATVLVAEGTNSATFVIGTNTVLTATTATISATYAGITKTANLAINPFNVVSVTLSPTSVIGSASTTANKVTMSGAALVDTVVNLSSNNPSVTVPPSVTVAAGTSVSPVFTITTSLVSATTPVLISASYNGASKTATLTVNPFLATPVLSPTSLVGGVSSTANKVTLNAPAPAGGILVNLSASDPGVGVPASVAVAAGATASPAFTITTSAVSATTSVTISASYNGVIKTAILTVNPVALLSVALSPASVVGGVSTTSNKVNLNAPAPAGGIVVNLSPSDPGVGVPASVLVAAGATASPVFTITTSAVAATTSVTISASYNGVTKAANLTVNPVGLLAVALSPTSVAGGASSTANKITLNGPAPAGGILVNLASTDLGVGVPPSVTVAAGATASPVFTITTSAVATQTVVTISASYNGVTKTANLTVNPVALLSVALSPASIVGGVSTTFNKVNLTGPAPAGGIVVTLTSSVLGVGVPASVTVAAGATASSFFTITTSAVAAPTGVTISASYHGVIKTASLTVNPVALLSITLSPASVVGGVSSTANKVTLNAPAPAGGILVNLSSDPGVGVPASVTVAAGATTSPVFTITTSPVATPTVVTIFASYNGVTKTANLTVNP